MKLTQLIINYSTALLFYIDGGIFLKKYWFLFVTLLFISLAACDVTDAKNETKDIEEKDLSQYQPERVSAGSGSNYNTYLQMSEKETFTIEADIQVRNVYEDN